MNADERSLFFIRTIWVIRGITFGTGSIFFVVDATLYDYLSTKASEIYVHPEKIAPVHVLDPRCVSSLQGGFDFLKHGRR
jgi:hypothetical protein